jgi:hypothetical protein
MRIPYPPPPLAPLPKKNAAKVLPPAAVNVPRTARLIYTLYVADFSSVALIRHRLQVNKPLYL